jgi:hypothetical protein
MSDSGLVYRVPVRSSVDRQITLAASEAGLTVEEWASRVLTVAAQGYRAKKTNHQEES